METNNLNYKSPNKVLEEREFLRKSKQFTTVKDFDGNKEFENYCYCGIRNILHCSNRTILGQAIYTAIEYEIDTRQKYGLSCNTLGATVWLIDNLMMYLFDRIEDFGGPNFMKSLEVRGLTLKVDSLHYVDDEAEFIIY